MTGVINITWDYEDCIKSDTRDILASSRKSFSPLVWPEAGVRRWQNGLQFGRQLVQLQRVTREAVEIHVVVGLHV